jgi:hypothetical protein
MHHWFWSEFQVIWRNSISSSMVKVELCLISPSLSKNNRSGDLCWRGRWVWPRTMPLQSWCSFFTFAWRLSKALEWTK